MILYFSGTGNSEYVAKRIGKAIGDEVVNLFDRIKGKDYSAVQSRRPWIVAVPTYAWRESRGWCKAGQSAPNGAEAVKFILF